MEKCKLEKAIRTQQMLENLVDKIDKLTSGNMSHNIPSIRSVTTNINSVMINDIINSCENVDAELKQLLEKIERNIRAVDGILQDLTPMSVNNGKKHLTAWVKFYADALSKALMKYEI
jgi:tRNA/tmRNA/rRNA uracil-C5-methylase (TrmA/RlmC/RlmD family)